MFLIQHFSLHGILSFSKSYPETESPWPTAKCRERKSFDMWYLIICATLCVIFSSKSVTKHILISQACDQSIQTRKKLFCHVIVNNYLCNVSCEFLYQNRKQLEAWNQRTNTPADFIYCGTTFRSSHWRCSIKKLFLKISQYSQETPMSESTFNTICFEKHPQTAAFLFFQWFSVTWA